MHSSVHATENLLLLALLQLIVMILAARLGRGYRRQDHPGLYRQPVVRLQQQGIVDPGLVDEHSCVDVADRAQDRL
ncbi:MAG TPA: hypothetical protein VGM26_13025 [Rhizomicrobium sp.]|jgi:hypothetical protein